VSLAIGVDVAARRGCDVVALGDDLVARPVGRVYKGAELTEILEELRPEAVAIDSPPRWAPPEKRRDCERELTRRGICLFTTPNEARGVGHPFYEWMTIGFDLFEAARGSSTLETFPHAIALAIHAGKPPGNKRAVRISALERVDVETRALRNIDQIDAALCAYTAWAWLNGNAISVGDEREGQITLPGVALLDRYV
jgi:predicted nuclease with RNAse H fold